MERKNKWLIIIFVIISIIIFSFAGYIVYDKVLKQDDNVDDAGDKNSDISKISESDALIIINDVTKKYFEYIHNLGPYCGEYDYDDYISFGSYETYDFRDYNASKTFHSIKEIRDYFESFMVPSLVPNYIIGNGLSYVEQDGKLYCQLVHKGCGHIYVPEKSNFVIDSIGENTIVSSVNLASQTCGDGENYDSWIGKISVIKDLGGNWLMYEYDVEYKEKNK